MTTQTMEKQYILNMETSKIELHFSKEEYQALTADQKQQLKRSFLFSGKQKAWVSRSKNNHYIAIETAKKLGFTDGGKVGQRLSFSEEMEREQERAEARAERFEQYADNAEKRAENLQSEWNEAAKDWSFVTQPNINSSKGRSFTNYRNRIMNRYEKGFDEYRKSEYFKERAETARMTADQSKLQNRSYLNNRIEECKKNMRQLEKAMVRAEETENNERIESLLSKMEYEMDKQAYFENCLDEIGGTQYSKENVKVGYFVKIRGDWEEVKKANPKTVETQSKYVPYTLKYAYAEIQDMKVPEGWTEQKKETVNNPFNVGEFVTMNAIGSDRIIRAYQVVKTTNKTVTIQKVNVEGNKPVKDGFVSKLQERRTVKENRNGVPVLNDEDYYLYKYNGEIACHTQISLAYIADCLT